MRKFAALHRRIDTFLREQRQKLLPTWLPKVCITESGEDLPGWEERNRASEQMARETRIHVKQYFFDVDEEGQDP